MDPIASFNEKKTEWTKRVNALHAALQRHDPEVPRHFAEDLLEMEDYRNSTLPAGSTPTMSLTEMFDAPKADPSQEWFNLEQEQIREQQNIFNSRTWSDEERERRIHEVQHDLISRGIPPAPPGMALHLAQARAYNEENRLGWLRDRARQPIDGQWPFPLENEYIPAGNTVDGLTFAKRVEQWAQGTHNVTAWEPSIAALMPPGMTLTVENAEGKYTYRLVFASGPETWEEVFYITPNPPGLTAAQERVAVAAAVRRMKEGGAPLS